MSYALISIESVSHSEVNVRRFRTSDSPFLLTRNPLLEKDGIRIGVSSEVPPGMRTWPHRASGCRVLGEPIRSLAIKAAETATARLVSASLTTVGERDWHTCFLAIGPDLWLRPGDERTAQAHAATRIDI